MEENATPQNPGSAPPQQAARRRERTPKSPDAKLRGLAQRKVQRQLEALRTTKDAKKLEQAAQLLAQLNGEPAAAKEPEARQEAPQQEQAAAEPVRASPAGVNPRGPAWPAEQTIAEFAPLAQQVVGQLAVALAGTRYAIHEKVRVEVGGQVVETSKADSLTAALAPIMAKYLPGAINSPEAALAVTVFTLFGVPALHHAAEKFLGAQQEVAA